MGNPKPKPNPYTVLGFRVEGLVMAEGFGIEGPECFE